jgi:hypothetical protein
MLTNKKGLDFVWFIWKANSCQHDSPYSCHLVFFLEKEASHFFLACACEAYWIDTDVPRDFTAVTDLLYLMVSVNHIFTILNIDVDWCIMTFSFYILYAHASAYVNMWTRVVCTWYKLNIGSKYYTSRSVMLGKRFYNRMANIAKEKLIMRILKWSVLPFIYCSFTRISGFSCYLSAGVLWW